MLNDVKLFSVFLNLIYHKKKSSSFFVGLAVSKLCLSGPSKLGAQNKKQKHLWVLLDGSNGKEMQS